MTLTRESLILMVICAVDLVSTVLMLNTRAAFEGNPIMSYYLRYGIGTFILMKLTLVLLPLFIVEWYRQFRPQFVRLMLRTAIATYLGIYLVLFLIVNVGAQPEKQSASPPAQTNQYAQR
jgi:hypothetical protein